MQKNKGLTRKIRTEKVKFYDEFTSANVFKRLWLAIKNHEVEQEASLSGQKFLFKVKPLSAEEFDERLGKAKEAFLKEEELSKTSLLK